MSTGDNNQPAPSYGQYGDYQPQVGDRVQTWRTVIPMHPLSVGETIDATMRLIRFNPVAFVALPVIVSLVVAALDMALASAFGELSSTSLGLAQTNSVYAVVSLLLSFVAQVFLIVAGTRITLASVRGQKLSLGGAMSLSRQNLGRVSVRLLGLYLIFFALAIVFVIVLVGIAAMIIQMIGTSSFPVLPLLAAPFAVFTLLFFAFYRLIIAPSAMVAEDIGPLAAMSRSLRLTKGSLGYFFGLYVAVMIIFTVLTTVMSILLALTIGTTLASPDPFSGTGNLIGATSVILMTLVISVIISPIAMSLINLIYINMRMKRENFHQEFLYASGSSVAAVNPQRGPFGVEPTGQGQNGRDQGGQYGQQAQRQHGQGQYGQTPYGQESQPRYGQYGQAGEASDEWQGRPQWYGDADK